MITLNVIGLQETITNVSKLENDLKLELSAILESGAKMFVKNAKRDAPIRTTPITKGGGTFGSNLKQQITYLKESDYSFQVVSGASYSPYMEWGTIQFVNVPGELADYAIQFKGKGIRKNGGIRPRPFFFKQTPLIEKYLNDAVQDFINRAQL